jgi:hypothetical protein
LRQVKPEPKGLVDIVVTYENLHAAFLLDRAVDKAQWPRRSGDWRTVRHNSSAARPDPRNSQNAQRNYERYLALARAEAQIGNTVGAEHYYQYAEHYFRSMRSDSEGT